jgi:hypothetical protein
MSFCKTVNQAFNSRAGTPKLLWRHATLLFEQMVPMLDIWEQINLKRLSDIRLPKRYQKSMSI